MQAARQALPPGLVALGAPALQSASREVVLKVRGSARRSRPGGFGRCLCRADWLAPGAARRGRFGLGRSAACNR